MAGRQSVGAAAGHRGVAHLAGPGAQPSGRSLGGCCLSCSGMLRLGTVCRPCPQQGQPCSPEGHCPPAHWTLSTRDVITVGREGDQQVCVQSADQRLGADPRLRGVLTSSSPALPIRHPHPEEGAAGHARCSSRTNLDF